MKKVNFKIAVTLAVISGSTLTTACGTNPTLIAPVAPVGFVGGSACISQANGQSAIIGFNGTNVFYNGTDLVGGTIPASDNQYLSSGAGRGNGGKTVGSMIVAGAAAAANAQFSGQGPDGTIHVNLSSSGVGTQSVNVNGAIALSNLRYQILMQTLGLSNMSMNSGMGMYPGYNNGMIPMPAQTQQICFQGISMSMGVFPQYGKLYAGRVYLTTSTGAAAAAAQPVTLQW